MNDSIAMGSLDPCSTLSEDELKELNVDLICAAFELNDVTSVLQNVQYPVTVCHSPTDEIVPIESVPDLTGNDNISYTEVEGSHNEAGGTCIFNGLLYFLSPAWQTLTLEAMHSTNGCDAAPEMDGSPTVAPMVTSNPTPMSATSNPTDGSTTTSPVDAPADSGGFSRTVSLAAISLVVLVFLM